MSATPDRNADAHRDRNAHVDSKPNTDQHGNIYTNVNLNTRPLLNGITTVHFDAIANGEYECRIKDAHGKAIALLIGNLDLDPADPSAFDFHVRTSELLPVRSGPQPHPHPDTDLQPDSYPIPARPGLDTTDPDDFIHTHRHAHRARFGEFLSNGLVVERYDHTHGHAHPGAVPDDRTYHNDHDH